MPVFMFMIILNFLLLFGMCVNYFDTKVVSVIPNGECRCTTHAKQSNAAWSKKENTTGALNKKQGAVLVLVEYAGTNKKAAQN